MAKLLLVEDDNNLREIYGARLMAEGFEIVAAADGEEALAMAVKEKPDLIISDVMMPKISGFDMLDILRTTAETKDTKVIMMTALSQPEDRARGESLGADRYLVKSQVTLEDVVATVHEVLGDGKVEEPAPEPTILNPDAIESEETSATPAPVEEPPETPPPPAPAVAEPLDTPATVAPVPSALAEEPVAPEKPTPAPEAEPKPPEPEVPAPKAPEPEPEPTPEPAPVSTPEPESKAPVPPEPASKKKKVISPISDPDNEPDIMKLAAEEEARENEKTPGAEIKPIDGAETNISETIKQEKEEMEEQIQEFVESSKTSEAPPEVEPSPEVTDEVDVEEEVIVEESTPLPPEPATEPEVGGTVQPETPVEQAEEPAPDAEPPKPDPGKTPDPNDIAL